MKSQTIVQTEEIFHFYNYIMCHIITYSVNLIKITITTIIKIMVMGITIHKSFRHDTLLTDQTLDNN